MNRLGKIEIAHKCHIYSVVVRGIRVRDESGTKKETREKDDLRCAYCMLPLVASTRHTLHSMK